MLSGASLFKAIMQCCVHVDEGLGSCHVRSWLAFRRSGEISALIIRGTNAGNLNN